VKASVREKYPRVLVEWTDSGSAHQWDSIKAHSDHEPCYCMSVGFLLVETDKAVVLVQSIDDGNQNAAGSMTIPRVAVTGVYHLFMGDEPIGRVVDAPHASKDAL